MADHYRAHLDTLMHRYQASLERCGFDAVIISAGVAEKVRDDDHAYPYHPNAFAQQWLPEAITPGTCLLIRPGETPQLYWPAQADFWHLSPSAPSGDWTAHWQLHGAADLNDWLPTVSGRLAWIGPAHPSLKNTTKDVEFNPTNLHADLAYDRAYKTEFEVEQLWQASRKAVPGHRAAADAFNAAASEADIYAAFLAASGQLESLEPYPGIIALNENAATLHYERRLFDKPQQHRSLLIDAGAQVGGYASDITRTCGQGSASFDALLAAMETFELDLCAAVRPGLPMADLHQQAVKGVAGILKELDLCRLGVEEQLEKRIPQAFFPHGLGHLLGLQVHDIGGHQQDRAGTLAPNQHAPFLRLTRTLEAGMVLTIEPGLYMIPMLLDQLRARGDVGLNEAAIAELRPWGGVRIEDNVLVTAKGSRNLTREAFDELA
ncbi:Xaa-Pro dipeptidase [Saccharospirillum sp. MSK14-1]|uniref:Xaa-Pro dipeptidase n=1 Tax=Saccharospirillum sp. MSK14-1 TaxID=1897632 RepID=UPI000D393DB3|nr:Xaa-Pro dipeptidase [Saccharospirillum sp. MSK14-1]PTY37423.1 Xaa-Pro dipeptidase [Saccharospirillum sp. MSK14-1]